MNWKLKSLIQNALAELPPSFSYKAYFLLQTRFGSLKIADPTKRLPVCVEILDRIARQSCSHIGKTFFEVGTGWRLVVPLGLWLCGAGEVITFDKNPYLSAKLVFKDIDFMKNNPDKVRAILGRYADTSVFQQRFEQLCNVADINGLFRLTGIKYSSPADAACSNLPANSIDFHISYAVFEHVPPSVISDIATEFVRIAHKDALFIHGIDFSDHFSHSDKSITTVNFLQFSEKKWDRYAGNRYMYQNRLRIDELYNLLTDAGLSLLDAESAVNQRSLELLKSGYLILDERFKNKSPEINATSNVWITATVS